ncbi:MAG: membrane protein insertase YidC [Bradymonadales bacterium]
MEDLTYNAQQRRGGGGSSLLFIVMMLMLVFVALPYFNRDKIEKEAQHDEQPTLADLVDSEPKPSINLNYPLRDAELETQEYKLNITNAGGGRLKNFFIKDPDRYAKHGDFIRSQVSEDANVGGILPFEFKLDAIGLKAESQFEMLPSTADAVNLKFTDSTGLIELYKTFRKTDVPYTLELDLKIRNGGSSEIRDKLSATLYIKQIEGEEPGMFTRGSLVAAKCFADGGLETIDASDEDEAEVFTKEVKWIAADESYYGMAIYSPNAGQCEIANKADLLSATMVQHLAVGAGETVTQTFKIYLGPKEAEYLKPFGHKLEKIIDYGWMTVLAKPMAWLLKLFESWLNNWGLAIILLTIIIRILLWPIAQRSQESMIRMSKLSPEMKELQTKYKDDPQELQRQTMALYKEHNINPLGCLPLFLQMPVFFALYRTIFVTGGLYNAEFGLWIHDLSSPDPYFILPALIVGLFVLQQLITPQTVKSTQQKVMLYSLPIVFGVMMLFLPSGLCLYMVVSTGFSVLQGVYTRRKLARLDREKAAYAVQTAQAQEDELDAKARRAAKRREKTNI